MTGKELGTAAGDIFTTQIAKSIQAKTGGNVEGKLPEWWAEFIGMVLAELQSTGRLIPAGGVALTAEQVEDVRIVLNKFGFNQVTPEVVQAIEAAERLNRALFPATEPAQERCRKWTVRVAGGIETGIQCVLPAGHECFHDYVQPAPAEPPLPTPAELSVQSTDSDCFEVCEGHPSPPAPAAEVQSWPSWGSVPDEVWFTKNGLGPVLAFRKRGQEIDHQYRDGGIATYPAGVFDFFDEGPFVPVSAPVEPAEDMKPISRYRTLSPKFAIEHFGFPEVSLFEFERTHTALDGSVWGYCGGEWELREYPPAPAEPAEEETKAERDSEGIIRINGGRIVALSCDTREMVQRWFDIAKPGSKWHRDYAAALDLFDREAASSPVVPAPTETEWKTCGHVPIGIVFRSKDRHPAFTWVNEGGSLLSVRNECEDGHFSDGEHCLPSMVDENFAPFVAAEEG